MELENRLIPLPAGWTEKRVNETSTGLIKIDGQFVCAITKTKTYTYDEKGNLKCAARCRVGKGIYKHCENTPVKGSNRCRYHGGYQATARLNRIKNNE